MASDEKKTAVAPETEKQPEETYAVEEIAANAPRLFGYSIDIAAAAFEYNGIKRSTLKDAERTIKAFAERKVK